MGELNRVDLNGADLNGADLNRVDLNGADPNKADLGDDDVELEFERMRAIQALETISIEGSPVSWVVDTVVNEGPGLGCLSRDGLLLWDRATQSAVVVRWHQVTSLSADTGEVRTVDGDRIWFALADGSDWAEWDSGLSLRSDSELSETELSETDGHRSGRATPHLATTLSFAELVLAERGASDDGFPPLSIEPSIDLDWSGETNRSAERPRRPTTAA